MLDLPLMMSIIDAVLIPAACGIALLVAKLTHGEMARKAEKNFFVFLVVMTLITIRTVVLCDDVWLIHTTTLAVMVVGALAIPGNEAFQFDDPTHRDAAAPHHYAGSTLDGRQMT